MRRFILGILILVVLALLIGFATGYLTLNSSGQLKAPELQVNAKGGEVPRLDVDAKDIVVGTTEANVNVPNVGLKNTTIRVPSIGLKDDQPPAAQNQAANSQ